VPEGDLITKPHQVILGFIYFISLYHYIKAPRPKSMVILKFIELAYSTDQRATHPINT